MILQIYEYCTLMKFIKVNLTTKNKDFCDIYASKLKYLHNLLFLVQMVRMSLKNLAVAKLRLLGPSIGVQLQSDAMGRKCVM